MICKNSQNRLVLYLTFCSGVIFKNRISRKMYTHTGVSLNSFLFRRYFQKWNFTQNVHPHRSFVNFRTGCKLLTLIDLPFQVCPLLDQFLVFVFAFFVASSGFVLIVTIVSGSLARVICFCRVALSSMFWSISNSFSQNFVCFCLRWHCNCLWIYLQ